MGCCLTTDAPVSVFFFSLWPLSSSLLLQILPNTHHFNLLLIMQNLKGDITHDSCLCA